MYPTPSSRTTPKPAPTLSGEERNAYLALTLVPGIGAAHLSALLDAFGRPRGVLCTPGDLIRRVPGIPRRTADLVALASPDMGESLQARVVALGAQLLLPGDESFPASLTNIPDPPLFLVSRGRLELLDRPLVAIVGSRDHTRYGADVCRTIASAASAAGLVVVSGMARGLDAVAHEAALTAGGGSIGVLAHGVDVVYPKSNRRLYDRMLSGENGLLITEFGPGERPTQGSFPRRNRMISGLVPVTVIVEASAKSGALVTAEQALRQGREVLVVPGPITSAVSVGANRLIRDGATPLLELDDLLTHYSGELDTRRARQADSRRSLGGRDPQEKVLALLTSGPTHADDLAGALGLPVGQVLGLLGAMEITGVVRQEPCMVFSPAVPVLSPDPG